MKSMLNWGKLVAQGRAKAVGVSWSDEEAAAVSLFAQTFNKPMSEVARYVRQGILTIEDYKKAQEEEGVVNPYLKLSKEDLLKKAQKLELAVSPDATVEVLAEEILKQEKVLARKKAKAEKEAKEKKEAEEKEKKEKEATGATGPESQTDGSSGASGASGASPEKDSIL